MIKNILERRNINYYGCEVEKKVTFSRDFKKTNVARWPGGRRRGWRGGGPWSRTNTFRLHPHIQESAKRNEPKPRHKEDFYVAPRIISSLLNKSD